VFNTNATGYDPASHDVVHALVVDARVTALRRRHLHHMAARRSPAWPPSTSRPVCSDPTFTPPTPDAGVKSLALPVTACTSAATSSTSRRRPPSCPAAADGPRRRHAPSRQFVRRQLRRRLRGHTGAPTEDPTLNGLPFAIAADDGKTVWWSRLLDWGTTPANDTKHQHGGLIVSSRHRALTRGSPPKYRCSTSRCGPGRETV